MKNNGQKGKMLGHISGVRKFIYFIGAALTALLTLFVSACLTRGENADIMLFIENAEYYSRHFAAVFSNVNLNVFIPALLFSEFSYACLLMIGLLRPNKFLRGKEYGSAEWGDPNYLNSLISSKEPPEALKVYYTPEKTIKRMARKLFERKKDYIK